MTKKLLTLIVIALLCSSAIAQGPKKNSPKLSADPPGLKVGEKAPAFKLTDQKKKTHSLETLGKDKYVAIVFYRSGQW